MSAAEHGDRFNLHPSRRTELVVMASEIQRLPKLEGYLCIAGLDRARVRVRPCPPRRRQIEFIARALPKTIGDERSNTDLIPSVIGREPNRPNGTADTTVRIQD
jgi:hypothetical protein